MTEQSTLEVNGVASQSGYGNATTANVARVQGDPAVAGGLGFKACPVGETVGEMRAIVNETIYECTVGGMR
jgi:hypothetical protein